MWSDIRLPYGRGVYFLRTVFDPLRHTGSCGMEFCIEPAAYHVSPDDRDDREDQGDVKVLSEAELRSEHRVHDEGRAQVYAKADRYVGAHFNE